MTATGSRRADALRATRMSTLLFRLSGRCLLRMQTLMLVDVVSAIFGGGVGQSAPSPGGGEGGLPYCGTSLASPTSADNCDRVER